MVRRERRVLAFEYKGQDQPTQGEKRRSEKRGREEREGEGEKRIKKYCPNTELRDMSNRN